MGTQQLEAETAELTREQEREQEREHARAERRENPNYTANPRVESPEKMHTNVQTQVEDSDVQKDEQPAQDIKKHHISPIALILFAVFVVLLFAALFVLGVVPRLRREKQIDTAAANVGTSAQIVTVVKAQRVSSDTDLDLPGNIEAVQVAMISARTSGYLKARYVDIGDHVRANQLLAEIDAPEMQQEIEQAQASLRQAQAALGQTQANLKQAQTNADFAKVTWDRWNYLVGQGVVSKQDSDEKEAAYNAAKEGVNAQVANIKASEANINNNQSNIKRLKELQAYQKIYAPFAGVITARFVDIGSLIGSSSSSGGSTPGQTGASGSNSGATSSSTAAPAGALFSIARMDSLRIYVNVPQGLVSSIHPGQTTTVTVKELPNRTFTGHVVRTASALDAATRTLLTEVQVPNQDGALLPGMYGQVKFGVTLPEPAIRIPASALIATGKGTQVATVVQGKIHYQTVVPGRDLGKTIDIISGLDEGDMLVVDPTASMQEGAEVEARPAANPDAGKNAQQGGPKEGANSSAK